MECLDGGGHAGRLGCCHARAGADRAVFWSREFGVANGFSGVYPQAGGAIDAAGGFAFEAGGGVDYHLNHAFSLRLIQADWLRTQLPNGATNVQNNFLLGAGVVWHIR